MATTTLAGRKARRFAAAGLLALAAVGCTGEGPYPVDGKVTWADGSPAKELAGSQVVFELPEKRTSARGVVAADGTYALTTNRPGDGALVGHHKVCILENLKPLGRWEGDTTLADPVLDGKFGHLDDSGLRADVQHGHNTIPLTVAKARRPVGKR